MPDSKAEPESAEATKAYALSCTDDDHGMCVVFATTAQEARQRGNGDYCDCGYINLRAKRAPAFDKYCDEPGSITVEQYLAEGWRFLCSHCEGHVYSDQPERVLENGRVFCCEECRKKWHKTDAEWRAKFKESSDDPA